jgi:hypothetical protein
LHVFSVNNIGLDIYQKCRSYNVVCQMAKLSLKYVMGQVQTWQLNVNKKKGIFLQTVDKELKADQAIG